jgi:Peptidase M50B-like
MNASSTVLGTLALAIIAVAFEPLWLRTGRLITLVHETGHGVTLLLSGRWVKEIVLQRSGGYTAYDKPKLFWPADVMVTLAGYSAPPIAGLFLALGVDRGWNPATVLGALLVILVGTVLFHGNWLGLVVMVSLGLVLAFFLWQTGPTAQVGVVIALAWFLLLGGLRRTIEIAGRPAAKTSDQAHLEELTSIHANVWVLVFLTIALATFITGARALLQH